MQSVACMKATRWMNGFYKFKLTMYVKETNRTINFHWLNTSDFENKKALVILPNYSVTMACPIKKCGWCSLKFCVILPTYLLMLCYCLAAASSNCCVWMNMKWFCVFYLNGILWVAKNDKFLAQNGTLFEFVYSKYSRQRNF